MIVNPHLRSDVVELCQWSGLDPAGYKRFDSHISLTAVEPDAVEPPETPTVDLPPPPTTLAQEEPAGPSLEALPKQASPPAAYAQERVTEGPLHRQLIALASVHHARTPDPAILPLVAGVGGCGITTVLATLGRALSILGERVLLVDSESSSTLPLFYESRNQGTGLLLSTDPLSRFEGAVHMLRRVQRPAASNIGRTTQFHRVMAELAGDLDHVVTSDTELLTILAKGKKTSKDISLVILTPETRSTLAAHDLVESLNGGWEPWFLINRFNKESARDVQARSRLEHILGDRLLPFCIPESPSVEEALLKGVTVVDLAPQSEISDAFFDLAEWYRAASIGESSLPITSEENQLAVSTQF